MIYIAYTMLAITGTALITLIIYRLIVNIRAWPHQPNERNNTWHAESRPTR
jgi:hypothetical protein